MKPPNFFRKVRTKIIKTIWHNTKRRRPRFRKKPKAVLISIRYRKTSQTQDEESQSTERSVQKIAQPKRDSAFEQETRIVSSGEIWRSSQNRNFSNNQWNKPSRAQKKTFLERTKRRYGKFVFSLRWKRPIFSGTFGRKSSKQFHTIQKEEDHVSEKKSKAVFISIRYRKISPKQDVKSQSTEGSVRKLAQPKRDSAFEQETHIVSCREISASSQNSFFSYNQRKKQSRAKTDVFATYSTSFWKVGVFLSVKSPNFFRKVRTKIIKHFHTIQNDEDHVSEKNQKLF